MIKINNRAGFSLVEVIFALLIIGVVTTLIMTMGDKNEQTKKATHLSEQTVGYAKAFSDYIIAQKDILIQKTANNQVYIIDAEDLEKVPSKSGQLINYLPLGVDKTTHNALKQRPCVAIIQSKATNTKQKLLPILFYVNEPDTKISQSVAQNVAQKAALMLGGKGGYGDSNNTRVNSIGNWTIKLNGGGDYQFYNDKGYVKVRSTTNRCLAKNNEIQLAPGSAFLNFNMFPYFIGAMDAADINNDILLRTKDLQADKYPDGNFYNQNTTKTDFYMFNYDDTQGDKSIVGLSAYNDNYLHRVNDSDKPIGNNDNTNTMQTNMTIANLPQDGKGTASIAYHSIKFAPDEKDGAKGATLTSSQNPNIALAGIDRSDDLVLINGSLIVKSLIPTNSDIYKKDGHSLLRHAHKHSIGDACTHEGEMSGNNGETVFYDGSPRQTLLVCRKTRSNYNRCAGGSLCYAPIMNMVVTYGLENHKNLHTVYCNDSNLFGNQAKAFPYSVIGASNTLRSTDCTSDRSGLLACHGVKTDLAGEIKEVTCSFEPEGG